VVGEGCVVSALCGVAPAGRTALIVGLDEWDSSAGPPVPSAGVVAAPALPLAPVLPVAPALPLELLLAAVD
jgi:hypothetical protein